MTNIHRQAVPITPDFSASPRRMLSTAAIMLPTAESAWSQPSAIGRARSGITSATSATPDRELAADAQAGQEPIEREVVEPGREGAQAGEQRVQQDGQEHRPGPADPVAQDPKARPPTPQPIMKMVVA